ncbi:MAG: GMP synthase [Chloroflexi bacterium]|nr:GMP synthase [Chloroflexota bacterium]
MKVGILNAIHPDESKVNWQGTPVDTYIHFFQSVNAPFEYTGYDVAQGQFPASPTECDAYIITGSPRSAYESETWLVTLAQFIRDVYAAGQKMVGICFGHQMLAQSLGGRVEKSEKGWGFGLKQFDVAVQKPWMTGHPNECSLYFVHQDQIMQLPPQAELLGGNVFCPNTMYEINGRVLGIQGHPEITLEIMDDVSARLEDIMERGMYETAVQSLQNTQPDNQLVGEWIVNFLTAAE